MTVQLQAHRWPGDHSSVTDPDEDPLTRCAAKPNPEGTWRFAVRKPEPCCLPAGRMGAVA